MGSSRTISFAAAAVLAASTSFAATHVVVVGTDMSFTPDDLTICVGDTVEWQWEGSMDFHSVTSGDRDFPCTPNGAFDSGVMSSGTFSHTFVSVPPQCATDDEPGDDTCAYFCSVHCPMMDGVIRIFDSPTGGIGITTAKLRVADPTSGRGGTIKGVEMLDGVTFEDVIPGTTSLTLELDAPGLGSPVSDSVSLDDIRGGYQGRFPANDSQDVVITTAKITGTTDPALHKLLVKFETNNIDLTAIGPITATVTVEHDVDGGDCGIVTVTATGSHGVEL